MIAKKLPVLALAAVLPAAALLAPPARADEALFGYVYTTDPMPKGHWEYEQWNTLRTGKGAGSYTAFDLSQELEHGFTDNFTASLYLHSSYDFMRNVPNPEDAAAKLPNRDAFNVNGASLELRYRLLSPYKDPIGLSFYMEPELSARDPEEGDDVIERSVEFKAILQKDFLDDQLVTAFNAVFEPEFELEQDGTRTKDLANEYTLGASYRFASNWAAGVEARNHRQYANQSFSHERLSAFYAGPNLHYGAGRWWTTLTWLPQVSRHPVVSELERTEVRWRFGVSF